MPPDSLNDEEIKIEIFSFLLYIIELNHTNHYNITIFNGMRKVKDYYYKKAREEQFAARSVYKLIEIDEKFHVIRPGIRVLDLGCAPGSWSQYMLKKIGHGKIVGIDIYANVGIDDKRFYFIHEDIFSVDEKVLLDNHGKFDLIAADLSPHTSGDRFSDGQLSLRLTVRVFGLAERLLKEGGTVVSKVFQGEDLDDFIDKIKPQFKKLVRFKPRSSRKQSRELYIVAIGMRKQK